MTLNPSMRPRVKPDMYVIDDGAGGVYLQGNGGSFRFEGKTIGQWIEKLLPMFTGEHTMEELTEDLSLPYKNRVYELTSVLFENGYIQDLSLNLPHGLSETVQKSFAAQIDFLENVVGSGGYHFESYRSCNALVIAADPFLVPLVSALFESGLAQVHFVALSQSLNRARLNTIHSHAQVADPEAELVEASFGPFGSAGVSPSSWDEVIDPYDAVFYVPTADHIEELRSLHAVCRRNGKIFLPASVVHQTGMVGPVVDSDSAVSWESAWRRVHELALHKDPEVATLSSTAAAIMTNTLVFELFKLITGVTKAESLRTFYLLDLETLQGDWHNFLPHSQANEGGRAPWVEDVDALLMGAADKQESGNLFEVFRQLTSPVSGIFHLWDEGDLKQLPLALCRVQSVDPLSSGPAGLLPEIVCSGINHEEARLQAGWSGIEAYVSRYLASLDETRGVAVAAGASVAEAVARGVQKCLSEELKRQSTQRPLHLVPVACDVVEDERCAYLVQVLTSIYGVPSIAFGEEIFGFPVVWVKVSDIWYGGVDLTVTGAMQRALESALREIQPTNHRPVCQVDAGSVLVQDTSHEACTIARVQASPADLVGSANTLLQAHGQRLRVMDLAMEPFLRELPAVLGVQIRGEGSE